MSLNPGETINNRYRIVKILGQGGFGTVYRAWDTSFNMACAVKENLELSPEAQRQFVREAKLLRTMKHANLPLVTDYFSLPGKGQYLVMDYIEGQDIEGMIAQSGPIAIDRAIDWIAQICDALDYLHAQTPAVIHRDIKPANIRITPNGQAILVDFGIAKVYDPSGKTSTGARALTPGYAPLEQYGLGKTDKRTDIYALSATLYTMLTGVRPVESVQRTIEDPLPAALQLAPNLPTNISAAIERALKMDPALRFQSAGEFKRALQSSSHQERPIQPDVAATLVAPAPKVVSPRASGAQAAALPQSNSINYRWGLLGGLGILALVITGLLVVSIAASYIYRTLTQPKNTPTLTALEIITQAKTPEQTITALTTSAAETHIPNLTNTPYSSVEMPNDIPLMPGTLDLQVYKMEVQGNITIVTFTINATVESIVTYYEREMKNNGWEKLTTYTDNDNLVLYFTKGERITTLMIPQSAATPQIYINVAQQ